jgi:hypothetical protein
MGRQLFLLHCNNAMWRLLRHLVWHTRCIAFMERGPMSRIETDQFSSQDDLPPEIQRRLQVEELWARRNVLAELMNAERLEVYTRRQAKLAPECAPTGTGSRNRLARQATVVPMRSLKSLMRATQAR